MDAAAAELQRIRIRGISDMTGVEVERDAALRAAIAQHLRASSSFSDHAIEDATSMLLSLGLPQQYYELHGSAAIADHVATILGEAVGGCGTRRAFFAATRARASGATRCTVPPATSPCVVFRSDAPLDALRATAARESPTMTGRVD